MSGAEAGFVIGLISGVISIIEATKTVSDAAGDAKGQPEAFRQVAARLPLVVEILRSAEKGAQALDETKLDAIEETLESCKAKAETLKKIFQKVIRTDDDKWFDRYKKALSTLGKGDKVECLMEGILKDTQLLACEKLMGIATESQVMELEEGIEEMMEMPSSLQDETGTVTQNHNGSGNNNANAGRGAMHTGTGDLYQNEIRGDAHFGSNPGKQVINYYNLPHDSQNRSCLKDLRTTDPSEDKKRIENTKGGLLKDSYRWILEHSDYQQWRDDTQRPLLWIKGDPGKGKTMLVCGIIDEVSRDKDAHALLSYFFCQATDMRLNNATAVLRGLIYLLIKQQPSLISHVQKRYNQGAKTPFEGVNAWTALSMVFEDILMDTKSQSSIYLIIDALDECDTDLPQLLNLITQSISRFPYVKWVVSSRNKPDIEARLGLDSTQVRLSLELNEQHVSRAIEIFIDFRVSRLPLLTDHSALQETVRGQIYAKAAGTFLWVAFVLEELEPVESWDVVEVLDEMPPGLAPLYHRMIQQIDQLQRKDPEFCHSVIGTMMLAYRPLHLLELGALSGLPEQISKSPDLVARVVHKCGSFLTIRESTVFFIHQSAKDFLFEETDDRYFSDGRDACHHTIFSRSLQVLSRILRRDIYKLKAPGITIDQVKKPDPDPLAAVRYSCLHWVDHLLDRQARRDTNRSLKDSDSVYRFLRQYFLYWFEALSLLKSVSEGIVIIRKLEVWFQADQSPDLLAFIDDAKRFARRYKSLIQKTPLQLYCSALVFAPDKSIVRKQFKKCIPSWLQSWPEVEAHWDAALQTLDGHMGWVRSVAFSPDGKQVMSSSDDKTIRLWDAETGALQQILEGHKDWVTCVAFSPDGKQVVSSSYDKEIRLWNVATGAQKYKLKGHKECVTCVAFSPDGKKVVSSSQDKTVRLWEVATGALKQTLKGHSELVVYVAFSPNGEQVVSSSRDKTIRLWDATTGDPQQTLEGHKDWVTCVAFSPDGKQVVSGSHDEEVRLWDVATGAQKQMLKGHRWWVTCVAFSPDGKQVVSSSQDKTVRLWEVATGVLKQTLWGHSESVKCVAFSPNGRQVVSSSFDKTIRIWDAATGTSQQTLEGHRGAVTCVSFSPDSKQVVSGSHDEKVRLWNITTEDPRQMIMFNSYDRPVTCLAFSPDGKQVVSSSFDAAVRLWDAATGTSQQTLEGHRGAVTCVSFSSDGKQVVSSSHDRTIQLWDAATGAPKQKFTGHKEWVTCVAFSPDAKQVVSGSRDKTIRLWDAATGAQKQRLTGHRWPVTCVAFSPDNKQVVSGSEDRIIWLWDVATGAQKHKLEGHREGVTCVAFSPDGKQIVSGSHDKTVWLWNAITGAPQQTLEDYSDVVRSVAFSPDGKLQTLRVSSDWILEELSNLLWLTPKLQSPTCQATWNRTVVLGYSSGKVLVFQFAPEAKLLI